MKIIATCLNTLEKIKLTPKFELALYTGKNEKIDNDSTTIHITLSPFKLLIILIIFLLHL